MKIYSMDDNGKITEKIVAQPRLYGTGSTQPYQGGAYNGSGWNNQNHKHFCKTTHQGDFAYKSGKTGVSFFGSQGNKAYPLGGYDLVVDLGGASGIPKVMKFTEQPPPPKKPLVVIGGSPEFQKLNDYIEEPEPYPEFKIPKYLDLDWPDMQVPRVKTRAFWEAVAKTIPKNGDVLVACQMGHGRTGTFIALMAMVMDNLKAKDAIDIIRQVYCESAIETIKQEDYLKSMEK